MEGLILDEDPFLNSLLIRKGGFNKAIILKKMTHAVIYQYLPFENCSFIN